LEWLAPFHRQLFSLELNCFSISFTACTFYSTSEYPSADTDSGKFVRIKEDHKVGEEIFAIDVYPRSVPKPQRE
jgi:hypothetical protein